MMTTFDCDLQTRREVAFENFFDSLQDLKYILTSDFSSLQEAGLTLDQLRWVDLFRYHLFKVMDVFQLHPLYAVVYGEEDVDESSS